MWLRWPLLALLAFVALHSASYGLGFVTDPTTGAGEFGANDPPTEAAENLAGLVGVILLLFALTTIATGLMVWRQDPMGPWLGTSLGLAFLGIGIYWATRARIWDAGFYASTGILLAIMGAWLIWHRPSPEDDPTAGDPSPK